MKNLKPTLVLAIMLLSAGFLHAQYTLSSVKIYPPADRYQFSEMIGKLEIDHYMTLDDGAIQVELGPREMQVLRNSGYQHQVLVPDVAERNRVLNNEYLRQREATGLNAEQFRLAFEQPGGKIESIIPTPSRFEVKSTFGGYYRYQEMEDAIDELVADFGTGPNAIISKSTLGTQSAQGRDIYVVKISDNVNTDDTNEPEVLFVGVQHAREAIGGSSMIFLMQFLCENYGTDPRVKALVDNREIYIIPCMNPDGWEHNYSLNSNGGGMWRKNRRSMGGGNYGADLNRNWGVDWGNCSSPIQGSSSSCGSFNASADTYFGPSAFSEPETRAIRDFTYTRDFVAMIDQHSYGPYYSLPYGRESLHPGGLPADEDNFYNYLSAAMGKYNGMRAGNSYEALVYEVAGGVKDWMLRGDIGVGTKQRVFGFTGEGGGGGGSFWPPMNQIIYLCKGMTYQNLQLLYMAGSYVDMVDKSDVITNTKSATFNFQARRVGLGNEPVTVTLIPIENVMSADAPVTISSIPDYYDTYNGNIGYTLYPALTNGQRIRFAWQVSTGGITYSDTITKFYHSNPASMVIFEDNMDGNYSTNWSTSQTNAGTTQTNSNNNDYWRFTASGTGYGGGSSKAMSESNAGSKYRARVTYARSTLNSTLNLTGATAAYLTFWVKHFAENHRDKLQVQVSTNGSTWTALRGLTTIEEKSIDGSTIGNQPALTGIREDWIREMYDLSDYLGQSNLRLRFEFTSDATSNFHTDEDDGFYIDNLQVIRSTSTLVTLPVQFLSFTGYLQPDETVRLDWAAITDQQHDRFEVEKSSNGIDFVKIGNGPANAPYWHIDPAPYPGNNFYRIKQYDIDGDVTYSHIVNIYYNPSNLKVNVYPNPVKDVLTISITSSVPDRYSVTVTDLAGRKVHEEKQLLSATQREVNINLSAQSAQMFIVTVRNGRNEIIATRKVTRE